MTRVTAIQNPRRRRHSFRGTGFIRIISTPHDLAPGHKTSRRSHAAGDRRPIRSGALRPAAHAGEPLRAVSASVAGNQVAIALIARTVGIDAMSGVMASLPAAAHPGIAAGGRFVAGAAVPAVAAARMSRQGCADAEQLSVIRLGWQNREDRAEKCRQKEKPRILLDGHDEPHVVKKRRPAADSRGLTSMWASGRKPVLPPLGGFQGFCRNRFDPAAPAPRLGCYATSADSHDETYVVPQALRSNSPLLRCSIHRPGVQGAGDGRHGPKGIGHGEVRPPLNGIRDPGGRVAGWR